MESIQFWLCDGGAGLRVGQPIRKGSGPRERFQRLKQIRSGADKAGVGKFISQPIAADALQSATYGLFSALTWTLPRSSCTHFPGVCFASAIVRPHVPAAAASRDNEPSSDGVGTTALRRPVIGGALGGHFRFMSS